MNHYLEADARLFLGTEPTATSPHSHFFAVLLICCLVCAQDLPNNLGMTWTNHALEIVAERLYWWPGNADVSMYADGSAPPQGLNTAALLSTKHKHL